MERLAVVSHPTSLYKYTCVMTRNVVNPLMINHPNLTTISRSFYIIPKYPKPGYSVPWYAQQSTSVGPRQWRRPSVSGHRKTRVENTTQWEFDYEKRRLDRARARCCDMCSEDLRGVDHTSELNCFSNGAVLALQPSASARSRRKPRS